MQSWSCKVEPVVACELDAEDAELVPLHRVLERPSRRVHAVEGGDQRVLVDSLLVALPQKVLDVPRRLPFRQEPTVELAGEHLWIVLEDRSAKSDRVRYKVDLLLRLWVLDVVHRVLKVREHLVQRQGAHLCVEPLVVEEDVVEEVFVPVAADQLEGQLTEN